MSAGASADPAGLTARARPKARPDRRFDALNAFFTARNDIVHQLDYKDINGTSTARNHRTPEWTVTQCDRVLLLLADLIKATASLVK